jgi:hypothetical protein
MRPIIDFLNEVRQQQRDRDLEDESATPLEQTIEDAEPVSVEDVNQEDEREFDPPETEADEDIEEPDTTVIQYSREKEKVREVKDELGVSHNTDVGKQTFEYYYITKVEDEK